MSFGTSVLLLMLQKYPNGYPTLNILDVITTSVSSIFGINIMDANDPDYKTSARINLFVIFISGSLFFYFYGAFLTSALAVPSTQQPFNSPEGVLKTSYG